MRIAFLFIVYCCSYVYGGCNFRADKHTQRFQDQMKTWKIFEKQLTVSSGALTYSVGICKSPINATDSSAIIQQGTNISNVLGRMDRVNLVGTDNWILLTYENGDPYINICDNSSRTASIMFSCGPNMNNISILQEQTDSDTHCNYMFQLQVPEMCPIVKKVEDKLSGGAIFLIIFFSVATAYLVIGGTYLHVKRGARGLDRIPNLEMWRKLGQLSADGCDFCCRCERATPRAGYLLEESGLDYRGDDDILSP
ncbi:unnamed protein product [Adineta steineri]|uniref:MRH domain-containing protein n=1 Tax=Adineta steineri TaxID=433720 RepID=A0A818TZ23_9BILA|nr:unnamed protein product [Adineta steineri]